MTLPASGTISLSQVAVELGRASNATTSLGETAVRNLAGIPSGAISLNDLHGKSLGNTVTVGSYFNGFYTLYGYIGGQAGSISPSTWQIDGATITNLYWINANALVITMAGAHANSGWTNMTVDGTAFARTSASYLSNSTETSWTWSGITTNPFGTTSGVTKLVTWS